MEEEWLFRYEHAINSSAQAATNFKHDVLEPQDTLQELAIAEKHGRLYNFQVVA